MMAQANRHLAYRAVTLLTLTLCLAVGVTLFVAFLQSTILPASSAVGRLLGTNYWVSYLAGTAGCLFITWACFLATSLIRPQRSQSVGAASAAGLLVLALLNLAARFSGEFTEAAEWQRLVSLGSTFLALGFIWLQPSREVEQKSPCPE